MKLLYISTTKESSQITKEKEQLIDIFKQRLGIELDIDFIYDKDYYKKLSVGKDKRIEILDIYNLVEGVYDWVHVRLTDSNWRKLKLQPNLYGLQSGVLRDRNETHITYGRWNEFSSFKQSQYFQTEIKGLYEHVLGMLHEFIHSQEGEIAVSHSYLYGYDRLYTRAEIRAYESKNGREMERRYDRAKLIPALDFILNKNNFQKQKALIMAQLKVLYSKLEGSKKKYSEEFEKAVIHVLNFEGGYVDNPLDKGGETKYGISKRAYPSIDIKNLTKETATEIYYRDYWLASSCDRMEYNVALIVFDMSVNHGVSRSIKLLQKVLKVTEDGIIGMQTLGALRTDFLFPMDILQERTHFYLRLPATQLKEFGRGWINRVFDLLNLIYIK